MPGYADVLGAASSNAFVTVNNKSTYRKGEYYRVELAFGNNAESLCPSITNVAVLPNGTNADITATDDGKLFLARTPESFTYDADGNLTSDGRWTNRWDAENRLIQMESLSNGPSNSLRRLNYGYDFRGRRILKSTELWINSSYVVAVSNKFAFDSWNLMVVLNATNGALIKGYTWGNDLNGSMQGAGGISGLLATTGGGAGEFLAYGGNGDTAALISATDGTTSTRHEYGPYGEEIRNQASNAGNNSFGWSTKYEEQESGLLYYGYRYYGASLGRWLSRDPLEEQGGLGVYVFVQNSPINHIDKLGLLLKIIYGDINITGCDNCWDLLAKFKYIPEDDRQNFKLFPLPQQAGKVAGNADALYTPVGVAFKIYDYGSMNIDCNCVCKDVYLSGGPIGVKRWNQGEPMPSDWPGGTSPFTDTPPGFRRLLYDGLKLYPKN